MAMFKQKKKAEEKPVEVKEIQKIEDLDIEDEQEVESEIVSKNISPQLKKEESIYSIGDIIPIQQIVGYQIIKEFDEDGNPIVTSTDKQHEAEILSFIYQQ